MNGNVHNMKSFLAIYKKVILTTFSATCFTMGLMSFGPPTPPTPDPVYHQHCTANTFIVLTTKRAALYTLRLHGLQVDFCGHTSAGDKY